jgi:hypothetical protein
MKRPIFFSICIFILVAGITFSCNKKEFRGCNSSKRQFTCTINSEKFVADIDSCTYDSLNRYIVIYAKDSSINTSLQISITYPMQNLEVVLKPTDSLLRGKIIGVYNGQVFESKHGNFGMDVTGNSICGQFFSYDNVSRVNLSVGKFTNIPWSFK